MISSPPVTGISSIRRAISPNQSALKRPSFWSVFSGAMSHAMTIWNMFMRRSLMCSSTASCCPTNLGSTLMKSYLTNSAKTLGNTQSKSHEATAKKPVDDCILHTAYVCSALSFFYSLLGGGRRMATLPSGNSHCHEGPVWACSSRFHQPFPVRLKRPS